MSLSYEEQRLQNIRDNQALLLSLGLHIPAQPPRKTVIASHKKSTPLRKALAGKKTTEGNGGANGDEHGEGDQNGDENEPRTPKRKSENGAATPDSELRRSGRNSEKKVDYSDATLEKASGGNSLSSSRAETKAPKRERAESKGDDDDEDDGRQRNAKRLGVRTHDPRSFGSIPGVEVGRWWATRMEASTAAIHGPPVAGISGNAQEGAFSVALSGGYPDDVDLGEAFTYTGCGGRDLKGTKQNPKNLRTAPQTSHQSFDNPMNAALRKSAETRKPVRVIRGFKLDSPYAPPEGYRYDGLYVVEKAWMAQGLTKGLMVCRYAFKRLEGQPDLEVRDLEAERRAEEEEAAKDAKVKYRRPAMLSMG